jgi:hypothetical protein
MNEWTNIDIPPNLELLEGDTGISEIPNGT